jgi:diacylglycerol kinase family enzyme
MMDHLDANTPSRERTVKRDAEIILICNPQAGGRWKELAGILDSEEARHVRRIVTDSVEDIAPALEALGREAKLICIYGGDGTIQRVLDRLSPRDKDEALIALIGGGTMNVTATWCGFDRPPAENFRSVIRAYRNGNLLLREVPLLEVRCGQRLTRGFIFGLGPMVRVLNAYEQGTKSRRHGFMIAVKAASAAWLRFPLKYRKMLEEMEAEVLIDGERVGYDRFALVFANITGQLNPGVTPFVGERTRDTFFCAAYASESREVALALPLLAKGILPIDTGSLLRRLAPWTRGEKRKGLPTDPRYLNRPASRLEVTSSERMYTVDGEILTAESDRIEVDLGLRLKLAVSATASLPSGLRRAADAVAR